MALLDLGLLAEERGIDSTGIATLHSRDLYRTARSHPAVTEHTSGGWRIRTSPGAFSFHLPRHHQLRNNLSTARLVLGHTRWATQGACTLPNASPMSVGDVIGTHNGDVTAPPGMVAPTAPGISPDEQSRHLRRGASALPNLRGRAALARVGGSRPEKLFWRAPLSACNRADRAERLRWASNPECLGKVDDRHGQMIRPVPKREGTLHVLRSDDVEVTLLAHRRFTATSRPRDERLDHNAAWRGFHPRRPPTRDGQPRPSGVQQHRQGRMMHTASPPVDVESPCPGDAADRRPRRW